MSKNKNKNIYVEDNTSKSEDVDLNLIKYLLPNPILDIIMTYYAFMKASSKFELNNEYKSYILAEYDVGGFILARMSGMPLLVDLDYPL